MAGKKKDQTARTAGQQAARRRQAQAGIDAIVKKGKSGPAKEAFEEKYGSKKKRKEG
jgi:hypothetical protein